MPDKFSLTEISDFALFRIGGDTEMLMDKTQGELAEARLAVDKIKDKIAALLKTEREINAEINRRGLRRYAGSDDA